MRYSLSTILVVGSILPAALSAQTPIIDYHQHLFSPGAAALVTGNPGSPGIGARRRTASGAPPDRLHGHGPLEIASASELRPLLAEQEDAVEVEVLPRR